MLGAGKALDVVADIATKRATDLAAKSDSPAKVEAPSASDTLKETARQLSTHVYFDDDEPLPIKGARIVKSTDGTAV